jgi:acyl dehydratase
MESTKFEDIPVGDSRELGSHELTQECIVTFAEQFDPQPFHVDPDAAARSPFDGLIASGLHTMSICQRLVTDGFYEHTANVAGLGIDETRFLEPVRPEDELTARIEVTGKRPLESRDDRGLVTIDQTLVNQHGEPVLTNVALTLVERR